jgi:hypothetical protein
MPLDDLDADSALRCGLCHRPFVLEAAEKTEWLARAARRPPKWCRRCGPAIVTFQRDVRAQLACSLERTA